MVDALPARRESAGAWRPGAAGSARRGRENADDGEGRRPARQKIEHFRIAAYGTTAALAGQLDVRDEQRLLHQSLEEEKVADEALTQLAIGEINRDAVAA